MSPYEVELTLDEGGIYGTCTCPHFYDGFDCKHIWATFLAARQRGFAADAPSGAGTSTPHEPQAPAPPAPPVWELLLDAGRQLARAFEPPRGLANGTIHYHAYVEAGEFVVLTITVHRDGQPPKPLDIRRDDVVRLPDEHDRRILGALQGGSGLNEFVYGNLPNLCELGPALQRELLPYLASLDRFTFATDRNGASMTLENDTGGLWELSLVCTSTKEGLKGDLMFQRGDDRIDVAETIPLALAGLFIHEGRLSIVENAVGADWRSMARMMPVFVAADQIEDFIQEYLNTHGLPTLVLPKKYRLRVIESDPQIVVLVSAFDSGTARGLMTAQIRFDYDGQRFERGHPASGCVSFERRAWLVRNAEREAEAIQRLVEIAVAAGAPGVSVDRIQFPGARALEIISRLHDMGWIVEVEGSVVRPSTGTYASISSGVDWFDLEGEVEFGDLVVALPEVLRVMKPGVRTIRLDDGTVGILPEEWVRRMERVGLLGKRVDDAIRFDRRQIGLLDALLAIEPEIDTDKLFTAARKELLEFRGITPAEPSGEFHGELRQYQKEGLGWMHFLRRFGFGGCLADDMGLGKTVQVLALLEARRSELAGRRDGRKRPRRRTTTTDQRLPSLAVVPKSLLHNWMEEAARFAPQLDVGIHHGLQRDRSGKSLQSLDLVLTTYGTLQRDIEMLAAMEFDYIVLDEAQAIKNPGTKGARAARALKGRNRLALSGTPVENHLGELWSIFEFLNPGLLGASTILGLASSSTRDVDDETRALIARAVRPFLLRRTKKEVAKDLPEKTEQTIICDLGPKQRKVYDGLREYYRGHLMGLVDARGLGSTRIQVLEALLRLRQAACHPALINDAYKGGSAKLETLLEMLEEIVESGSKALVFSQFTSMLALVRKELDARRINYEYLDGRVRKRKERIDHWKEDPDCPLFLISLKAGGTGLNLTEAEYVFLLDPWWNPAVEAQAIDRTHRIGQTRPVFAYRLIAADTVEERILQLQETKRDLATAIVGEGEGLMRDLQREDIEMLLS